MTVARSTQQYIDVLYTSTVVPTARLTTQHIDVLYTADSGPAPQSATSVLSLTQDATVQGIFERVASNALSLSQDTTIYNNEQTGNTLNLTQLVSVELVLTRSVTSILALTQSATVIGSQTVLASNVITVSQSVSVIRLIPTQSASNALSLTQSADWSRPVTSTLNLTQSAVAYIGGTSVTAESTLSLTQSATVELTITAIASSVLALTQSASTSFIGDLVASNALSLQQLAVGTIIDSYMTLYAPYPGVAAAIILPKPSLGDKENTTANIKVRHAMDGTMYTTVKRPLTRVLSYTFNMTRQKGLELEEFLTAYNGERIKLQNFKGEIWDVQLLSNPLDFVQNRRSAPVGQVGVNLQFEGVKISG